MLQPRAALHPSRTYDTFATAMPHARLAIALKSRNAWSETFIAAHIDRLQERVLVLSDGHPPRMADGAPILVPTDTMDRMRSLVERKVQGVHEAERLQRRTVALLRERKVQVLLAEYGNMGETMVDICRAAGVPLVAHFHGYDAHRYNEALEAGNYARLFAQAKAVVAVSRSMERRLLDLGAPREKVFYNCYGIDVERFKEGAPRDAPPHFLAVGRFVDKKAPILTLLAFSKVVAHRPKARLTMVGHGPLWEACYQLVAALGLQDNVELGGIQSQERIAELLRGSRAFVQHSVVTGDGDSEGTPLAVLEAMATGIPVVATRHAGIADVVAHEQRGLLCAERDVDTMAANMLRLVDDEALAGTMGRAGRTYVEQHHRVEDRIASLQGILDAAADRSR